MSARVSHAIALLGSEGIANPGKAAPV